MATLRGQGGLLSLSFLLDFRLSNCNEVIDLLPHVREQSILVRWILNEGQLLEDKNREGQDENER